MQFNYFEVYCQKEASFMGAKTKRLNIFDYTDYRKYLFDYYLAQKQGTRAFSYRYFAKKAGINSIGLYKDVIEGRQSLGRALIFKFSAAIGHSKNEAEYFENMVYFNESKSVEERKLFFERMMACQSSRAKIIDAGKYEYYSRWYYSAVRALLTCKQFKDDPDSIKEIAHSLNPQIRPDQAQKALKILETLGFVRKDVEGYYILCEAAVSTGSLQPDKNVAGLSIMNYQKEMIKLSLDAFDRFSSDRMNMSTLTLSMSAESLAEIKNDLAALRNKIAGMAARDPKPEDVFQLNIQLFPMSENRSGATHA